ncbi:biotin/lipoyl-containing protein [Thermophagus sp. OGC60D27]|uniref:biotin/lipoyl-containing protein n=1 Tax=Thermophagus sp. OGC60D27 TaxID=3458415 RepID=UPI00403845EB
MKDDNRELVDFQILSLRYKTKLTRKYKERKKYRPNNPKEVRSVIPGTITDIMVKKGQKVKKGDVLLQLEAMKMVNNIQMPFDGKIKSIDIEKGQKVPKDYLMIEIE